MADETTTKNDSSNVSFGKFKVGGYAYAAPVGTPLPTDSESELDRAFQLIGYLSEDGITNTTDTDTAEVKDANGMTVMKVVSSYSESYQFVLIEFLRKAAAEMRYGENAVIGQDKRMVIKHQIPDDTPVSLVFEIVATGNVKDRTVIGSATRSEFGDRQMRSSDVLGYDLTVNANDMGDGVTSIEYIGIPKARVPDRDRNGLTGRRFPSRIPFFSPCREGTLFNRQGENRFFPKENQNVTQPKPPRHKRQPDCQPSTGPQAVR